MTEKLLVEFDVEKNVEREFGYVEKLIKFRNTGTRYKAIVKDGELVAILGRDYKLIPNEEVANKLKFLEINKEMSLSLSQYGWRLYGLLKKRDLGALVKNSVDGTHALTVDSVIFINGGKTGAILSGVKALETAYRRHTKNCRMVDDLEKIVPEIFEVGEKYKEWLAKLDEVNAKDNISVLEGMTDLMPKKYCEEIIAKVKVNNVKLGGAGLTLKDVYEAVSRKIWSAEVDMRTKIRLYSILNDIMFSIVSWE